MDVVVDAEHCGVMTAFLLIVALFVLFAVLAPVFGADTRESREWQWGERRS